MIRELVKVTLSKDGELDVIPACNGKEAVELAKATKPDLAILATNSVATSRLKAHSELAAHLRCRCLSS